MEVDWLEKKRYRQFVVGQTSVHDYVANCAAIAGDSRVD